MKVAALVDDMFFSSKLRATANNTGCEITFCSSSRDVPEEAARVIVDLGATGFDPVLEIEGVKQKGARSIVAFGRHTDTGLMRRALEAGADEVIPRSDLVRRLGELLGAPG